MLVSRGASLREEEELEIAAEALQAPPCPRHSPCLSHSVCPHASAFPSLPGQWDPWKMEVPRAGTPGSSPCQQ